MYLHFPTLLQIDVHDWESQLNAELSNDKVAKFYYFTKFLNKRQSTLKTINFRNSLFDYKHEKKYKLI